MRKVFILCFSLLTFVISAEESRVVLSYNSGLTYKTGYVDELVYNQSSILSKLHWEERNILGHIFNTSIRYGRLSLSGSMLYSLPCDRNYIQDYDYLFDENISHFSEHNNQLEKDVSLYLKATFCFPIINSFEFIPYIGYFKSNKKFSAYNGYSQYPEEGVWTGNESKKEVIGYVISYEQQIDSLLFGFDLTYLFNKKLKLSFNAIYYPTLHIKSLDSHFLRKVQFLDVMDQEYAYELGLKLTYLLTTHLDILVNFSYQKIKCSGLSYSNSIGYKDSDFVLSPGITSLTIIDSKLFSISMRYNF